MKNGSFGVRGGGAKILTLGSFGQLSTLSFFLDIIDIKMAIGGAFFGGPTARSQSKVFVEFNAGKVNLNPTTKMVSPDKRKGMLTVLQVTILPVFLT